jgi:hypothetical protein
MQRMEDGAKPGVCEANIKNPEAAMSPQSENSFEGLPEKIPGEPE